MSFLTTVLGYVKKYSGLEKFLNLRSRTQYTVTGTLVVFLLMLLASPDLGIITDMPFGAEQLVLLTIIAKSLLYATLLHVTRKAFMDYPEADFRELIKKSIETPMGAGLVLIAISLMTLSFSLVIAVAQFA